MLGLLLTTACDSDRDSNPTLLNPDSFVLNLPAYASTSYDLKHSKTLELTCSQPEYGFTAATTYAVQVSLTGEFVDAPNEDTDATYRTLANVFSTARMNVDAQELAVAIVELSGITEEENFPTDPIALHIRLKATVGDGLMPVLSNPITLPSVIPYFALPPVLMPENMYLIGSLNGWNWNDAYSMVPVYGSPGKFWRVVYFDANTELKFNSAKNWDGNDFGFEGTTFANPELAGVGEAGGNILIANAGWYIAVVTAEQEGRDLKYTVAFNEAKVYVCGPTVGDKWGADGQLFEVPADGESEFVSPTLGAGELRMCVVLEGHEWWHTEFIFFDGKIAYRGADGDQERVDLDAGKKVYLNFTKGEGRVE